MGHCRIGQYLHWAKVRPSAQCWVPTQTTDHLFKVCPEWRTQQKVLWAEVQRRPGGGRAGGRTGTCLPMDGGCGRAVLDFLASTGCARAGTGWGGREGRGVGARAPRGEGAGRRKKGGGGGAGCRKRVGCRGGASAVPSHALFHVTGRRGLGGKSRSPLFSPVVIFFGVHLLFLGTGLGGGQRELATSRLARTADGSGLYIISP